MEDQVRGDGFPGVWAAMKQSFGTDGHFPHLAHPGRFAQRLAATAGWQAGSKGGPDVQTGASSAGDGSATGAAFGTRRPASSATAKMASALRPCSTPTMAAE